MGRYIYFDILDTARTKLGGASDDIQRARENTFRGQAELKMSLLCGWNPVFPQTYGWDSSALLDYGAEESFEGESFRWLLRKGLIRIRLRDQPSIWDAALAAFANPAFQSLSAWPEFNTENPLESRRPLVETMRNWQPRFSRTRKYSEALPEQVCNRLELLRQASDAAKQAPPDGPELPRSHRLSRLIKVAAEAAKDVDPNVASLLSRCTTDVSDPNNRTAIDTFLDREMEKVGDLPPEVREITNGCFNAVAAECVLARPALTLPKSSSLSAEILLRVLPGSVRSDLFEAPIGKIEVSELEVLGWHRIKELLEECESLSATERVRRAEAAKMISNVAAEKVPVYAMRTNWTNILYNTAIWGTAVVVSIVGAGTGSGILSVTTSQVLAGQLAGALGSLDVRSKVKVEMAARLEKKWLGLLQARENYLQSGSDQA